MGIRKSEKNSFPLCGNSNDTRKELALVKDEKCCLVKKFTNLKKYCEKFKIGEITKNGEFKSKKKKHKLLL